MRPLDVNSSYNSFAFKFNSSFSLLEDDSDSVFDDSELLSSSVISEGSHKIDAEFQVHNKSLKNSFTSRVRIKFRTCFSA